MAFVRRQNQQGPGVMAGGAPSGLLSTGGPQTAGAAGGGAAPGAKGGGYVNLQDYLRLNQGGAQQMAGKVGDFVSGEGKGVQSALTQAQSDFDAARLAGMGTNLTNGSELQFPDSNLGGFEVKSPPPGPAPMTDEQMDAFRKQSQQTYSGPMGLAGIEGLTTKATKAADDAQMASRFGGLAGSAGAPGLISQVYGGHSTQGGSNLDAFLAGSTGQLGGLSEKYGKLGDALNSARDAATASASSAASETARRAAVAAQKLREEEHRRALLLRPPVHMPGTPAPLPVGHMPLDSGGGPREPDAGNPLGLPTFRPPGSRRRGF
jgi:hypothetical protein